MVRERKSSPPEKIRKGKKDKMAKHQVTRRQKDIARVLRDRKMFAPVEKVGKAKKGGKKRQ